MAWGAALGAIVGSGSEGMASAAQYQASKHERNVAWKRAQQWELIAPSLRVAGLRAAGLNPVLAATGGMTSGASHIPTASTGGSPSFDKDSVGRVLSSAKQARLMNAQVDLAETEARVKREQERQEVQHTNILEKFGEATSRAELAVRQEQMLNLVAERGLTGARTAETEQAKLRIALDRMLMEMGVPGARAMEAMYEKYPFLRQIREFSGGSLGGAALGAGAGTAGYLLKGARDAKRQSDDFGSLVPGGRKRRKR